jgi:hypothetical protein
MSSMSIPFTNAAAAESKRWLLLFNCQAIGLGNCLNLLAQQTRVDVYDPVTFEEERPALLARLGDYVELVVRTNAPELRAFPKHVRRAIRQVPSLLFHGYHPDFCYLAESGPLSGGPLGHYHSAIAYAAFHCGLDEGQARELFRGEVYEQLGYYDAWGVERDRIVAHFDMWGFDIRQSFVDWTRDGPFMYTTNHPRIAVLRDIARMLLEHTGEPATKTALLPHDNLANGPCLPVYPEIGARIGLQGDYVFKSGGTYRTFGLEEFIAGCFAVYRAHPELRANYASYGEKIQRAIEYVSSTRCADLSPPPSIQSRAPESMSTTLRGTET